jgi:hypothetical protein
MPTFVAPLNEYPEYLRGDTWAGFTQSTTINGGNPPPSPLASARMSFRHLGKLVLELSTEDDTIQVVDAAAWSIVVPPLILPFRFSGTVFFDLEITAVSGLRRTPNRWFMKIIADESRD